MQSYPRTATVESPKQSPQHGDAARSRVMVGGMVLVLAGVVTAGAVLTARHNGWGANARTGVPPAVVSAAQAGDGLAHPAAIAAVASHSSRLPAASTVYLTDKAVEASRAQSELDAAVVTARSGQTPASIINVVAPGEAAEAFQAIADENQIRVTLRLPEIGVVDLRAGHDTADGAEPAARQAIADENLLRASLGLHELPAAE
jgi:hypothetical protein